MSFSFSTAELASLERAIRVLTSPLDHRTVNDWRAAVNHEVCSLLGAAAAGFLLPNDEGPLFFSREISSQVLERYPDVAPPPLLDGRPIWRRALQLGVSTPRIAYAGEFDRYLHSAYHNEYGKPSGAHNTLAAMVPYGGDEPRTMAALHVWQDSPTREPGDREVALMRVLFPAFRAGVLSFRAWSGRRTELLRTLDVLGEAVVVVGEDGRRLHQTPAMTALLAEEPAPAELLDQVQLVAIAARSGAIATPPLIEAVVGGVHYRVRGTVHGTESSAGEAPLVLVAVERTTSPARSDGELAERFGLTPAELRVTRLLARGRRNAAIATTLGISPHTARRHTERVLQKLGAKSRAEVAGKVMGG